MLHRAPERTTDCLDMTENTVAFYFSITSRYAYLASTQVERLAHETGCTIRWMPVDAAELRGLADSEPFDGKPVSGQYRSPYREQDLADWVAYYGVPYREPPDADGDLWWKGFGWEKMRWLSLATLAGQKLGAGPGYIHALFHLMFAGDVWPFDLPEVLDIGAAHGLSRDALRARISAPETANHLTENAKSAVAEGAFGVPSFVYRGKLFFGNDRLTLLKHHILTSAR